MAKESLIRKRAKEEAENLGYTYWIPTASKWNSNDIFTIFDMACWRGDYILLVQYTSRSNVSARKNKIKDYMRELGLSFPKGVSAQVWGYTDRKGFTRKISL